MRFTPRFSVCILALTILIGYAPSHGSQPDVESPFFVNKEDWAETMLASRERFLARYAREEVDLGLWYATAPQPAGGFAQVHVVPHAIDLTARDDAGQNRWTEQPGWIDGEVHNLPGMDWASTYLYRTIRATEPVSLTASFGSDDGIEVWLNHEKVLSRDVPRGVAPNQDRATLNLVEGENSLLIKIHNQRGGHGFYFMLKEDPVVLLWEAIAREFPVECYQMTRDLPRGLHLEWFRQNAAEPISTQMVDAVLEETGIAGGDLTAIFTSLRDAATPDSDPRWLELYEEACGIRSSLRRLDAINMPALKRTVSDLTAEFRSEYDADYLKQLSLFDARLPAMRGMLLSGDIQRAHKIRDEIDALEQLRRDALLANPLLDFEQVLFIKRKANSPRLGLPQNWQGNCSLPRSGYDDELCTISMSGGTSEITPFFKPDQPRMLADVDLHFDGDRVLFSMLGTHDRWQIFELDLDARQLRQVTPGRYDDVDNYDACYLPDGRIIFDSTRCFQGIPCVGGADAVANLYLLDEKEQSIRQLCFDQDHNWCPTVLNNGRVLFTRWEYSDTPHYFTRLLMHMNPDGTGQMEYYGSNSYWPNSIFYARPVPNHPTKVIAIVSGHHGVPRMGELILFDPALGRFEADGVVQRIPGYGEKVEPIIKDQLVDASWPRFLHPYPLSDKYFIASCKPDPQTPWGIYLVDIHDNMLLLAEQSGYALLEPVPLRPTKRPPTIPDKVRLDRDDATVFLSDIYQGPGLADVPRGTVKELRLFAFHYGYNNMGGHADVGFEGPWDVHRILGTVPVYEDGSAGFTIPANTPIALQPLDEEGKAVQLMRSWFTAMPGEIISCVGCHESQNTTTPVRATMAATRPPIEIDPWRGPARGFSFKREVQPVLNRYCIGCHDGGDYDDDRPDLSPSPENGWNNLTPAYIALHPYVRRPGPESDYYLLNPYEFHADTSELIQMLQKGHHDVELSDEAWDRLVTWIDLNVPDHGTWAEQSDIPSELNARRCEMSARYAAMDVDPEYIPEVNVDLGAFTAPGEPEPIDQTVPQVEGWPFDRDRAQARQEQEGLPTKLSFDLGDGVTLDLSLIPAGEFVMGSLNGAADEHPLSSVRIDEPFYMGIVEITCAQFARFDPEHFNGFHDQRHKDHTRPGYLAHSDNRPAIRVSWDQATAFCEWLSEETGYTCSLPTEAQWEWACRAGASTPFSYGDLNTDFSGFANFADINTKKLAVTGVDPKPIPNPNEYVDFLPKDDRFDDGHTLMSEVGLFAPNAWGLHDMHGNVSEWTRSTYRAYPYQDDDDHRNSVNAMSRKTVRGGSWRDRPKNGRSSWRLSYFPHQRVYNVGFRVVVQP